MKNILSGKINIGKAVMNRRSSACPDAGPCREAALPSRHVIFRLMPGFRNCPSRCAFSPLVFLIAAAMFLLPTGGITADEPPELRPHMLHPPQADDVVLRPGGKAADALPDPELLTGLGRISAATVDRVKPIAWIAPGKVLMPGAYLGKGVLENGTSESAPFDFFTCIDTGLWFYGDEAGRIFGLVREREPDDGVFHAYHLKRGVSESFSLWPPYALAPTRPLLAAQQGMLLVVPLFGSREGGRADLFSESGFITWAGDDEVVMDNSIENVTVTVNGVESPRRLPKFTSTRGPGFTAYPVAHDRVYPAPEALADGTVLDISHRLSGDVLWWWTPRPEHADNQENTERTELSLGGQAVALAARDTDSLVAVVVTDDRGSALRVFGGETWTADPGTLSKPPGAEIPLDRRTWQWGSVALLSGRLALAADDTGLVHLVSLHAGRVLHTISLPAPVIQAAAAGDRLIGLSLGPAHPGVLLGIK